MVQKIQPHNYKNEVSMTLTYGMDYMIKIFIPSTCTDFFYIFYCIERNLYKHEHNELHLPLHQHYTKVGPQPDDDSLHKKRT